MLVVGGIIGWATSRRREKADVKLTETSARQIEVQVLDTALAAINEKVVLPLTNRLSTLQNEYETLLKELKQLRNAITKMYVCRHVVDCPIKLELQKQQTNNNAAAKRKPATNRQREPGREADGTPDCDPGEHGEHGNSRKGAPGTSPGGAVQYR